MTRTRFTLLGALLLWPATASADIDAAGEPAGGTHALTSGFAPEEATFEVPSGGENAATPRGGSECASWRC